MSNLKWIIIGGGMQGCMMFNHLVRKKKATVDEITIIDPHHYPLELWEQYTSRIKMKYLRSPSSHHLDISSTSLEDYAIDHKNLYQIPLFREPYDRPALSLFNTHALKTINEVNIKKSWKHGRVKSLKKYGKSWRILIEGVKTNEVLFAQNVVLAFGNSENPHWPEWAVQEKLKGKTISHIFDKDYTVHLEKAPILICGGGLSGAHLALSYAEEYPGKVTLAIRHSLKVKDFETDLSWLEINKLSEFNNMTNLNLRRKSINEAKEKGSITKEIKDRLDEQVSNCNLKIIKITDVLEAKIIDAAESIILATGFESIPLGVYGLNTFIDEDLPLSECGYPILDKNLQWSNNLYCLGGLAELELGPISRNIAGARRGVEKILQSI